MAYGFATHLWIEGTPEPETLRNWVLGGVPDATERDLQVFRLGNRTLLSATNIDDREMRWRSISVVGSVASSLPNDVTTTFVNCQPDVESYEVDGEIDHKDAVQVAAARERLRKLVPLEFKELYHYVDWAHELEDAQEGAPAPSLPGVMVERMSLGLPAGQPQRTKDYAPLATGDNVRHPWVWIGLALVAAALFLIAIL